MFPPENSKERASRPALPAFWRFSYLLALRRTRPRSGHPNLTTDASSPAYATSIFNPSINIDIGVYGISDNRKQERQKFTGCTEDQYTLMAIGDYNSYGSTKSCTVFNTAYDDEF